MIVVFLNIKNRNLNIFSENGSQSLPFEEIDLLDELCSEDDNILYVLQAKNVKVQDIVRTVESLKQKETKKTSGKEIMFLRNGTFGALTVPGMYNIHRKIKEDFKFEKATDAKPLKDIYRDYGKEIFEDSPVMRNLLKSGKLQIVSESQLKEINSKIANGKIKKKHNKEDLLKYIKTISKEESEEFINMDITKSVERGPGSIHGGSSNEETFISSDGDVIA